MVNSLPDPTLQSPKLVSFYTEKRIVALVTTRVVVIDYYRKSFILNFCYFRDPV